MSEELGVRGMSVLEDKVEELATLFEKEERLASSSQLPFHPEFHRWSPSSP